MPSPGSTNRSSVAGHAMQIFLESRDSITSSNLPDPDTFTCDKDSWMIIDILLLAITGFDLFIFKFALTEVDGKYLDCFSSFVLKFHLCPEKMWCAKMLFCVKISPLSSTAADPINLHSYFLPFCSSGAGNLTIFRAFRIFRLARLVRVFKLLKSVARLVTGLQISFRTLFWAIFLIAVTVFVFAVLMVELVGKNEEAYDAAVRNNWKDLSSSATSFILLATASGWQRRVDALKDANALFLVPILLFMLLVVVGIFNMIIGYAGWFEWVVFWLLIGKVVIGQEFDADHYSTYSDSLSSFLLHFA